VNTIGSTHRLRLKREEIQPVTRDSTMPAAI
jgi:hypothetical protein